MSATPGNSGPERPGQQIHSFDEHLHPARPKALRYRPRATAPIDRGPMIERGEPTSANPHYVDWLRAHSMLADVDQLSRQFSGQGSMWQNPYAKPDPRAAVEAASVWFTAYPMSLIGRPRESFLNAMADDDLWDAFAEIGIDALHTGPVKLAGGIVGWRRTPTVDGHFDRISTDIDTVFGSEEEFRQLCATAKWHGGTVISDIVPGHTGKGADFRLAEMKHGDYAGIYHMVEVEPQDWEQLPDVAPGADSVNLSQDTVRWLARAGYIIGQLQRVIFFEAGVKESNWSATGPVTGVDGVVRRWVYLHYFKAGQPTINWLDPSFAGMRLVIGDALHSLAYLGTGALRLDANGFLGAERRMGAETTAWSEGHPLSRAANHLIASMVRKLGGFTFQELNLGIDDIRTIGAIGADLSYDFVNRPAYHHALVTADTEFLRLTLRTALREGVEPVSLIHALQNHDELTYELVHWQSAHAADVFDYRGGSVTGAGLAESVRAELAQALTGAAAPYNQVFTTNGIACTTATVIAAVLGITDLDAFTDVDRIRRPHLLLAMFNALQPGVFALSGWDLCGMVTLAPEQVSHLTGAGDTRWLHRGAHDLMGVNPSATESSSGMPRGRSLYGSLPVQLADELSFARQLQAILKVRARFHIATSEQIDIPDVADPAMLVMVHRLTDPGPLQVTVLNFAGVPVRAAVSSASLPPGARITDMFSGTAFGAVDGDHSFPVAMGPYQGMSLLIGTGGR